MFQLLWVKIYKKIIRLTEAEEHATTWGRLEIECVRRTRLSKFPVNSSKHLYSALAMVQIRSFLECVFTVQCLLGEG